jgi:hypothetical protein
MKTYEQFNIDNKFENIIDLDYFKSLLKNELYGWTPDKKQFYRVFEPRINKNKDEMYLINPKNLIRKSKTGDDFNNYIMSMWPNYPKRFNSSSFLNDFETIQKYYGMYTNNWNNKQNLYYMLPFNNANIAISNNFDINMKDQFDKIFKKYNITLGIFNKFLKIIYNYITNNTFDYESNMKFTETSFFVFINTVNNFIKEETVDNIIACLNKSKYWNNFYNDENIKKIIIDIKEKSLINFLIDIFNPEDNNFNRITFSWNNNYDDVLFDKPRELWTDSKYILMNINTFEKIKKEND